MLLGLAWTTWLFLAELCLRAVFVGIVLLRRHDPEARLAWVVIILLLPVIGVIAYGLVGGVRLGSRRIRAGEAMLKNMWGTGAYCPDNLRGNQTALEPTHRQIAALAESVGGTLPKAGNEVKLMGDTDMVIHALIDDIRAAEKHCHLLYYIYLDDHSGRAVAEALIEAEKRGVQCRLLVDDVGSRDFLNSETCAVMKRNGVQVAAALPVSPLRALASRMDLRNHRKIAVIDGVIGYTGSQNIADAAFAPKKKYAPWVDASVRIEGPVVLDLQTLFVEDWYLDTDEWLDSALRILPPAKPHGVPAQIIGTGPISYNEAMRQLKQAAIHAAQEELILTSPYFVPDESTFVALRTAARRGVRTVLIVPQRNDAPVVGLASRSYYESLLEAGVEIHEYTKGMLHAKTVCTDRHLAIVSSANLDRRSFELNFEVTLVVYDSDFSSGLRFLQTSYLNDSVRIDAHRWRKRGAHRRLAENAAGLFGPLL